MKFQKRIGGNDSYLLYLEKQNKTKFPNKKK